MNLALVFHNHQPVGQLPWAFEDVAEHCYEPFLQVLAEHPAIKVALHYTGPLLDWLQEHRPAVIKQLRTLVANGQVEILAGGYYEPILAIWPPDESATQIDLLRQRVHDLFEVSAEGLWLAERVWEPELAPVLAGCGIDYTFVDSAVFAEAGIPEAKQFGYYEAANELKIFPINQQLRYIIPWQTPEATIAYLKAAHEEQGDAALAVFADDGEKFGAWPGTFDFIYTEGWLDKFFTLLEENAEWLHLVTPGAYASKAASLGTVELPPGSYAEMQEWSRGNWRNFLERYPESREMYNELRLLHGQWQLAEKYDRLTPEALKTVRRHILRGQCNDAYWHGTFGGLYLRHLRQAIYAEIAQAWLLLDGEGAFVHCGADLDNRQHLRNDRLLVDACPHGGYISVLLSKTARHNLLSTLRRHPESYLPTDSELDWHARGALIDHFFGERTTPERFATARYPEEGDFASEEWLVDSKYETTKAHLIWHRDGSVWSNGQQVPISITKQVQIHRSSGDLDITYEFTNRSEVEHEFWWGCEWNAAVTGVALPDRHYHANDHQQKLPLDQIAAFDAVTNPIIADRWLQLWLEWQFDAPVTMWHVPIFTVSQKEGGEIERTHQSSAFVFHRRLHLKPNEPYMFKFKAVVTAKEKEATS